MGNLHSYGKWPFIGFPLKMRIFHTYVSLPEGNMKITVDNVKIRYKGIETTI